MDISEEKNEVSVTVDVEKNKKGAKEKILSGSKWSRLIYDTVSTIMVSFIIIAVFFVFAFRLVGVKGESMTNTLQDRDWLIAVPQTHYKYGDIVIYTGDSYFDEPLIKRVIATEGQQVDIDYETSTVYVNGVALVEPYTRDDFILKNFNEYEFPLTVPEGCLFCMGDNRNGSTDSRSKLVGPMDERYILGKAMLRIYPFGKNNIYDYE